VFDIVITTIILIFLATFREEISRIFTKEEKIVGIVNEVMMILILYIFFDTIHGVQSGIIRGLGLQVWGSIYTLICYYFIGLPLALWLAFSKDMGVYGLWLGFSIACIILDIGFMMIIECPNWHKLAAKVQE
jgi:MATE family multidrug resistance protein